MQIVHSAAANRFEAISSFSEKDAVKSAGFRWDGDAKKWWTRDATVASTLRAHADATAIAAIEAASAKATIAVAASRAVDADVAIPAPEGLSYLGYQRAGIAYAVARGDSLIADEMGLGKTIQALGVANVMAADAGRPLRILVVAPKIALRNWAREATKWLVTPHTIAVWNAAKQPAADIVVVNYDVMARPTMQAAIRAVDWDLAVYDEAHALKTPSAARTLAILGGKKGDNFIQAIKAGRRLFLTGTPILNRPIELYPVLHSIGFEGARKWMSFAERYCDGRQGAYGYESDGASNLAELQERLRASCMVRRLKADVLTELPAKRHQIVEIEADTPALKRAVAAEKKAMPTGDAHALRAAMLALATGKSASFQETSRLRHDTAVAKVDAVVEHVVGILEGTDEAVLVFGHHRDVIAGIVTGLEAAGFPAAVITGETSDADRDQAQADIQGGRKRVFVGSMHACGVAITLTAASTVIFCEQDWTPGVMAQAEDRAHRIGQANSVLVQHLVVDGSFDAVMAKLVAEKGMVIEDALDTVEVAEMMEEVAVEEAPSPVEAAAPGLEVPVVDEAPVVEAVVDAPAPVITVDIAPLFTAYTAYTAYTEATVALGAARGQPTAMVAFHIWRDAATALAFAGQKNRGVGVAVDDSVTPVTKTPKRTRIATDPLPFADEVRSFTQAELDEMLSAVGAEVAAEIAVSREIPAPVADVPTEPVAWDESPTSLDVLVDGEASAPAVPRPRGRPKKEGGAKSRADITREWRARNTVSKLEVSGPLAERVRAMRTARGTTIEALLAAALDALEAPPAADVGDGAPEPKLFNERVTTYAGLGHGWLIKGSRKSEDIREVLALDPKAVRAGLDDIHSSLAGRIAINWPHRWPWQWEPAEAVKRGRAWETGDLVADYETLMAISARFAEVAAKQLVATPPIKDRPTDCAALLEVYAEMLGEDVNTATPLPVADTASTAPPALPKPKRTRKPRILGGATRR